MSETNRLNRIQWAQQHKNFSWDHVIFSNGKIFALNENSGKVWIMNGDNYYRSTRKNRAKVKIWGAISSTGKSELHFINTRHTAETYQNILLTTFMKFYHQCCYEGVWYFQQDGAPQHTQQVLQKNF